RGGQKEEDFPAAYSDAIAPGRTHKITLKPPSGAASMNCNVADFLIIGPDEQKFISEFGPDGGARQFSKMRKDAYDSGLPIMADAFLSLYHAFKNSQQPAVAAPTPARSEDPKLRACMACQGNFMRCMNACPRQSVGRPEFGC